MSRDKKYILCRKCDHCNHEEKSLEFSSIKDALIDTIKTDSFDNQEDLILLEGFFNIPFPEEYKKGSMVGGPTIPMVAVLDNTSGRIQLFALKALIPHLPI